MSDNVFNVAINVIVDAAVVDVVAIGVIVDAVVVDGVDIVDIVVDIVVDVVVFGERKKGRGSMRPFQVSARVKVIFLMKRRVKRKGGSRDGDRDRDMCLIQVRVRKAKRL